MRVDPETLRDLVLSGGRRATSRLPGRWGRRVRESAKWALDYNGARASGLRGWTFARVGRHSPLLVAPFGAGSLLVDAADQEIGRVVYMRGDYERDLMGAALDQLHHAGLTVAGKTLIDVGANIGTTAIDGLLHFGFADVICFEPDRRNVRLLNMNLVLNDLLDRAVVHPIALSDRDDVVTVRQRRDNFGDSRVEVSDGHPDGAAVECARMDSLVARGLIDVDSVGLVWIDAQGHDPFVLNGASSITSAGIPVVVEYWPEALGAGPGQALLAGIISEHYSRVIDLRAIAGGRGDPEVPAADLSILDERYRRRHTDLLLLQ